MNRTDLTAHACAQVLRFTTAANWDDLSEERKVQLGFNAGLMALGLGLNKDDGYLMLLQAQQGTLTMAQLHGHFQGLVAQHGISVPPEDIQRPF